MGCSNISKNKIVDSVHKWQIAGDQDLPQTNSKSATSAELSARHFASFRKSYSAKVQYSPILNDYELGATLNNGGYSYVRKVTHKILNQKRAAKVFLKSKVEDWMKDDTYMILEAKVLSELDHPSIVPMYEMYQDVRNFYCTMELANGGELFQMLAKRKRFNEEDACKIMRQLLSAVAYCHEKCVVHRDLKPENILLMDSDNLDIKIADFGCSGFFDVNQNLSETFGSIYYIAPEVFSECYNEKCDEWSWGVILYILLCGVAPFNGHTTQGIKDWILHSSLQFLPKEFWKQISWNAIDLLTRLLTRSVRRRISATEALEHPWFTDDHALLSSPDLVDSSMASLRQFNSSSKLKDAIYNFIASQVLTHKDTQELRQSFQCIDKNQDGQLSPAELIAEYAKTIGMSGAEKEVKKIMEMVDTDHNGKIEYTEFIAANVAQKKAVSKEQLRGCFAAFDVDADGSISADELRHMLGTDEMEDIKKWEELLSEVDQNGDGVIDLKEFEAMLMSKF